jgi:hypothetical protein
VHFFCLALYINSNVLYFSRSYHLQPILNNVVSSTSQEIPIPRFHSRILLDQPSLLTTTTTTITHQNHTPTILQTPTSSPIQATFILPPSQSILLNPSSQISNSIPILVHISKITGPRPTSLHISLVETLVNPLPSSSSSYGSGSVSVTASSCRVSKVLDTYVHEFEPEDGSSLYRTSIQASFTSHGFTPSTSSSSSSSSSESPFSSIAVTHSLILKFHVPGSKDLGSSSSFPSSSSSSVVEWRDSVVVHGMRDETVEVLKGFVRDPREEGAWGCLLNRIEYRVKQV